MTVYLQDRRVQTADLITKLQHVFGGFPLLFIGLKHLSSGSPEWPMAIVEVAIGGIVILAFLREVRQTIRPQAHGHSSAWHHAIGWFDLAAGGLLIFEAFHQPHVKPGYLRPPFFSGVITIALGFLHGQFHVWRKRRRYLKLDAAGVAGRLGPFRKFQFAWADLKAVEVSETEAVFRCKAGEPRVIGLRRYYNADEIRNAITDHARVSGLLTAGHGGGASQPEVTTS